VKAYVLGDRILVDKFRRLVNNVFADALKKDWFAEPARLKSFSYAFLNIPSDRVILQCMVDDHCVYWPENITEYDFDGGDDDAEATLKAMKELPHNFLMRAMLRLGGVQMRRRCANCTAVLLRT